MGSVGNPLGDLEDRAHDHVVAGINASTSTVAAHGHSINPPLTATSTVPTVQATVIGIFDQDRYLINAPEHGHTVDGPLISSGAAGEHAHQVAIPELRSGTAGTGQVMPYVQLLACRNDSATAPALPAGATVHFSLAACPAGWSELTAARGRAVVGLRSGGTVGGIVGQPLANLEDRAHTHSVGPVSVSTSLVPAHVHSVDMPTLRSTFFVSNRARVWALGNPNTYYIDQQQHDHTVEVPTFDTSSGGAHTHQVTIATSQTTTAGTGQVMPYIQLLACRNDSATAPTVPAGAAAFFSTPGCPAGWSELTAARGRAVVGLVPGGTLGGTAGQALSDLEDRAHANAVAVRVVETAAEPDHRSTLRPRRRTSLRTHTTI